MKPSTIFSRAASQPGPELYDVVYETSGTYFRCCRCKESFRFRTDVQTHTQACEGSGAGTDSPTKPTLIRRESGCRVGSSLDEQEQFLSLDNLFEPNENLEPNAWGFDGSSRSSSLPSSKLICLLFCLFLFFPSLHFLL